MFPFSELERAAPKAEKRASIDAADFTAILAALIGDQVDNQNRRHSILRFCLRGNSGLCSWHLPAMQSAQTKVADFFRESMS